MQRIKSSKCQYIPAKGPFCLLIIVLSTLLVLTSTTSKAKGPKAADLVKDGQLIDLNQKKYQQLFTELHDQHNFTTPQLRQIFQGQKISKRVLELMDKQWEAKPYYKYSPLFITRKTIAAGKKKVIKYKSLLNRIEKKFGVDREVVIAIWGIETRYGTHQGNFSVLQTLNTLFDAYPRRSIFFRKQLVHFLILCQENNVDPRTIQGSYAGAFGQTQFIPSSFRAYAVSFDGDDKRDVWNSIPDVLASIANYLKHFHWTLHGPIYAELGQSLKDQRLIAAKLKGRKARVPWTLVHDKQNSAIPPSPDNGKLTIVGLRLPPGGQHAYRYIAGYPNFQAITQWNHSNRYAMAVSELAEAIKGNKKEK